MRNWIGRGLAASLVLSCVVGSTESTQAQQWANLEVTFIYDGAKVPERKALDMSKDPACTKAGVDELLVVNPENKGIQNVALWVDNKKTKLDPASIHPDLKEVPQNKVLLDNLNCIFAPHFIVVRAGATIEVKNSDTTGTMQTLAFSTMIR